MKRKKKNIISIIVIVAIVAMFAVYIKFFNGSILYISTGLGKNTALNAKNQSTSMIQADILLSDAKSEYEKVFGSDVWGKQIDGVSFEDYVKDQVKTKLIRIRCMNIYAKEKGVVLSRSEKENVEKAAKEYVSKLSDSQKSQYGITEDKMVTMFTEFAMAKTLYADMTSTAVNEVSSDDARVITIQYVVCDNSDDIKMAQNEINAGAVFYTVATKYNKDSEYESELKRGQMDSEFEKAAFNLKNGEVSKIVTANDKYYIIKCVSDNEKAKTEANKANIIEAKKLDYFNEQFKKFETSVFVEFNDSELKKKTMSQISSLDANFENVFDSYFK